MKARPYQTHPRPAGINGGWRAARESRAAHRWSPAGPVISDDLASASAGQSRRVPPGQTPTPRLDRWPSRTLRFLLCDLPAVIAGEAAWIHGRLAGYRGAQGQGDQRARHPILRGAGVHHDRRQRRQVKGKSKK